MNAKTSSALCFAVLSLATSGCGTDTTASNTGTVPWDHQRTQIVGPDGTTTELAPAADNACITYESACLKPAEKCGTQAADIVLDSQGKPLDYLCYPGASTLTVQDLQAMQGDIAQNKNDTVLVLADGAQVTGKLAIAANNVVIYGSSPSAATVTGPLTLDGNNALVRGVRIKGDVTITKNDATLAFCVIEGNLTISGNNTRLLACDVLGAVTVTGNNTQLHADHIAGKLSISGKNTDCEEDFAATDTNANHSLEHSELGAAISCK
ncbi:MAG: hypothetical protein JWN04_460 [Myxococcaceae bacterium]|nr:hypothetical protein [Myxococcaceae bacterium]